jgi:hypothetical protein
MVSLHLSGTMHPEEEVDDSMRNIMYCPHPPFELSPFALLLQISNANFVNTTVCIF